MGGKKEECKEWVRFAVTETWKRQEGPARNGAASMGCGVDKGCKRVSQGFWKGEGRPAKQAQCCHTVGGRN
jgi:hypothetical protein